MDNHGHVVMSVHRMVVCTDGTAFFVCGLKCDAAHLVSNMFIEQCSITSTLTPG